MAQISELSVEVGANTASFNAGMSRVEDSLSDVSTEAIQTAAALRILEGGMSSAGRESIKTSGMFSTLSLSTEGLTFSVHTLTSALIVGLVPALVTLTGALVPVVAALGGFLAVGGAIAGIGLVGTIGAIATHTEELKSQFNTVVDTLLSEFAPAFDLAFHVLDMLMEQFISIIPALVPAQDQLETMAGAFLGIGEAIINALPAFAELATTLAVEFLPPFMQFVQEIMPKLPGMIRGFVSAFRRVLPMFMEAGRLLGRLAPDLLEFGFAALNVVGPALGRLTQMLTNGIQAFNQLDSSIQNLIFRASLLAPIATTLITIFGGISAPVLALVGAVGALALAFQRDFAGIRTDTMNLFRALQNVLGRHLPELIKNVKTIMRTLAPVVEPILSGIIDLLSVGLVNAVDLVLSALTAFTQAITGDWAGAWQTMFGVISRVINRSAQLINKFTGGALQDMVNGVIKFINTLGKSADKFLKESFDFQQIQQVQLDTTPLQQNQQRPPAQSQDIVVTVEGDTDVVKQASAEVVNERERRTNRQVGRNPSPR